MSCKISHLNQRPQTNLVVPRQNDQRRLTLVILWAGWMAIGMGLVPLQNAIAAPGILTNSQRPLASQPSNSAEQLPPAIAKALRRDLSQQTGIPEKTLRFVEAQPKTWTNGCLDLAKPDEFCTQIIVKGWRVGFSNGTQRWVYRTDRTGTVYRLETPIKQSVKSSPLVSHRGTTPLSATRIPINELPPAMAQNVVFRAIASGGFIGRTYQTMLFSDGRLTRAQVNSDGTLAQPQTTRISAQQVQSFQHALKQHSFQKFHRSNYSATPGSADFITLTLSSHTGTVRYAETIRDQLPSQIQAVITAWDEISRVG